MNNTDKIVKALNNMRSCIPGYSKQLDNTVLESLFGSHELLFNELKNYISSSENSAAIIDSLAESKPAAESKADPALRQAINKLLFPQSPSDFSEYQNDIEVLRKHRQITLVSENPDPVTDPAAQILFTSNVLLTLPSKPLAETDISDSLKAALKPVLEEAPLNFYDHPVFIGTPAENNEIVYGLRGLEQMFLFEKERGTADQNARLAVVLSVSVTHEGINKLARNYISELLSDQKGFFNMDIYIVTEDDTRAVSDILQQKSRGNISRVLGVDGPYGRHYSFLKAVSVLWETVMDKRKKGTFKIDMDQVFPQTVLVKETGKSAFELLCNPWWGGEAKDSSGRDIHLGMLAGALVNEKDIHKGLFFPDIPAPDSLPVGGETLFFNKQYPMAVSTRAEMMNRDGDAPVTRIHVTGGTNGILNESLKTYRPFTPAFIGRAEDQGYLFSALFSGKNPSLRYLHAPGLIMRHDKEAFAGEAIKAAKLSTYIGDLLRTLHFTCYAEVLPWDLKDIHDLTDPFTGCFITELPFTCIYFRLLSKIAETGNDEHRQILLDDAKRRLKPFIESIDRGENPFADGYRKDHEGWQAFYDVLESLTDYSGIKTVLEECRITI